MGSQYLWHQKKEEGANGRKKMWWEGNACRRKTKRILRTVVNKDLGEQLSSSSGNEARPNAAENERHTEGSPNTKERH